MLTLSLWLPAPINWDFHDAVLECFELVQLSRERRRISCAHDRRKPMCDRPAVLAIWQRGVFPGERAGQESRARAIDSSATRTDVKAYRTRGCHRGENGCARRRCWR